MSKLILSSYTTKTGEYKSGINKGKLYAIAVCLFSGLNRSVTRIVPNPEVAKAFLGEKVDATLVEADVQPFTFQGKDEKGEAKAITTDKKWIVQFAGESLASAIKAHGKKPALVKAIEAPVLMQDSADVKLA